MRVHVTETFTECVSRLEGPDRTAVKRAAFDYLTGPSRPGHHLHRLVHARDRHFWSLRVSRDVRIILYLDGDEVVLCYADRHDRSYAWAAPRTGMPAGPALTLELAEAVEPREGVASRDPALVPSPPARGATPLRAVPSETESPRPRSPSSRRDQRLACRASAPLTAPEATAGETGPAPLVHLLRFFGERQHDAARSAIPATPERGAAGLAPGAPGPAAPRGPDGLRPASAPGAWWVVALCVPWVAAGYLGLGVAGAAALALGQALCAGWLLRRQDRRVALEVERAGRDAEGRVAALAAALESLGRGDAPVIPRVRPDGELGRAWASVAQLGRFLTLSSCDIRRLAERPVGPGPARRLEDSLPPHPDRGERPGGARPTETRIP